MRPHLFLTQAYDELLNETEQRLGSLAFEGVNAGAGDTSSTAFEREQLGVEAVPTKTFQRPSNRFFSNLVQYEFMIGHL